MRCVASREIGDDDNDCGDNSDENGLLKKCHKGYWTASTEIISTGDAGGGRTKRNEYFCSPELEKQTNAYTCLAHTDCAENEYLTNQSDVAAGICRAQTTCDEGKYLINTTLFTAGMCAPCNIIECPKENQYRAGMCAYKANNYTCMDQPLCGPGESISEETNVSNITRRECTPCPIGRVQGTDKGHRLTECDVCETGQYQDKLGQTDCLACAACQPGGSVVANCTSASNTVCNNDTIPEIHSGEAEEAVPAGFGTFEIGGGDTTRASVWQGPGQYMPWTNQSE